AALHMDLRAVVEHARSLTSGSVEPAAPTSVDVSAGRLGGVDDRDVAALAAAAKLGLAVADREDRVVAAHRRAGARAELRATLAHDDLAGLDVLAAEDLDAEVLRVGIAAVLRRAETLLVCHLLRLLSPAFVLGGKGRVDSRERALAGRVRLLVGPGHLGLFVAPALRLPADVGHGHIRVALRQTLGLFL